MIEYKLFIILKFSTKTLSLIIYFSLKNFKRQKLNETIDKFGSKLSTSNLKLAVTFYLKSLFNRERYHFLFSTMSANGCLLLLTLGIS